MTPHRDRHGPGRRSRPVRARSGSRNGGRRTEPRRTKPQGLIGALESRQGQRKGGDLIWDKAAETSSQQRAAEEDRNLGSRLRWQGRKRRDGMWRLAEVDPFPGVHSVKDQNRGGNQVQLSLRLIDGEVVITRGVTDKILKTVEQWYRDK